jgi:hypothetical protein
LGDLKKEVQNGPPLSQIPYPYMTQGKAEGVINCKNVICERRGGGGGQFCAL